MNLIERARNILLKPSEEWRTIERESATAGGLYTGYALPLAAIGPVAAFIGMAVIGISLPFVGTTFRVPFGNALTQALLTYGLTLVGVFVLALIVNALAPTFGGTRDATQALKLAVYGSTAAWVAGIFSILPSLGVLGVLGLYSIYLLYTGLPVLMKTPQEKAMAYTAVVVVCAIVVFATIGVVTGSLMPRSEPSLTLPNLVLPPQ